jgi:hypothetical protein
MTVVQIFVTDMTSANSCLFDVDLNDHVANLNSQVSFKMSVAPAQQITLLNGKPLSDIETLVDAGIPPER